MIRFLCVCFPFAASGVLEEHRTAVGASSPSGREGFATVPGSQPEPSQLKASLKGFVQELCLDLLSSTGLVGVPTSHRGLFVFRFFK